MIVIKIIIIIIIFIIVITIITIINAVIIIKYTTLSCTCVVELCIYC